MSAVAARPQITPADRLGLTLSLAVIIHAIVILGITFTAEDDLLPRFDTMEIILVQQRSAEAPEDPQMLAQENLEGGGETLQEVTPATPLPPPYPDQQAELTTNMVKQPVPDPVLESPVEPQPEPPAAETQPEALAAESPDPEQAVADPVRETTAEVQRERPSATQLLTNSFRIASLSSEIKRKLEARSERPRRKFISASTREYKYASYMEAWRSKVERVGNLNYPDEARRRNLSGSLILDVALNRDGSVNQITVRQSSGQKILDDAAIRIVNLAAPFAPFPRDIREETDILHITRTWQFLNRGGFR